MSDESVEKVATTLKQDPSSFSILQNIILVSDLKRENEDLKRENEELKILYEKIEKENRELRREIEELKKIVNMFMKKE